MMTVVTTSLVSLSKDIFLTSGLCGCPAVGILLFDSENINFQFLLVQIQVI